ncbi:MFS transporter [Mycolicibacterium chlorophenolicum]|uniref:Major Facilitator Superfamily protein n=1 Tax=Mycolicibacterium chlorophenolicum TaxID=37916 RepID=A0A0J6WGN7_9MYCO|nr:MFS transporter [Mycolicibacterium chlorophenolicum]KMO81168.1 Major Facilitator Superfamily protein [Mycolicibacterium chlorophenolicum]
MRTYRALFRVPRVLNITAAQLFARLPLGILSLAVLVHVEHHTGSYTQAGAVVACLTVGEAVAMPATSKLAGRGSRTAPTLVICAIVNGLSMLALAVTTASGVPLMALGLLVGASVPPLMPVVRALYPQMLPRDGVRALFALDTTAQEVIWVVGPVAAMTLSTLVSTALPLIVSSAITLAGTAWFLVSARGLRPRSGSRTGAGGRVLGRRSVLLAMVAGCALVGSFTALEVGVVAQLSGDGMTAGAAIALASVGSVVGGLTWGHRRLGLRGIVAALTVVAVGTSLFGLTHVLALQFCALFVSGLGFAPAMSALYFMVSQDIDESVATEAFGWLHSAALVGGALGTATAGIATDAHGASGAVMVGTLFAVVAAISPLAARATGRIGGLVEPEPLARATVGSPH